MDKEIAVDELSEVLSAKLVHGRLDSRFHRAVYGAAPNLGIGNRTNVFDIFP
jgi:hypothetical protein